MVAFLDMARFYSPDEIDPSILLSSTVAVLGYGNQGHAHALNLRDSGASVVVGAREGKGADSAKAAGFEVLSFEEATEAAEIIMLTLPDLAMGKIFEGNVGPRLRPGQAILFAHGFTIRYGLISPPQDVDVVLVSPKGAGAKVREEFIAGRGLAALVAVEQDFSGGALSRALAYAWGLGCARSVILETSFAEETETDLFGEQAVLCGGIPELIKAAFDQLVAAGYQPEVAYFECLHEAKLITDLIYSRGLSGMREAISDTAEWGGFMAGPKVIGPESRAAMALLLKQVRNGEFTRQWMGEDASGRTNLGAARGEEKAHGIEEVGEELRRRMQI